MSKDKELEVIVEDPQLLRPAELPLVVKPGKGQEWSNPEQAAYAKVLNGYAYKNPLKWKVKKEVLLKKLVEIGQDPSKFPIIDTNLGYKNKLIEK